MRIMPVLASLLCFVSSGVGAQMSSNHGVLGVATSDAPPNVGIHGALVQQVAPGSAASSAGVQPYDIIIGIDGRAVSGAAALTAYVAAHGPGETVTLQILRPTAGGVNQLALTATLLGTGFVQQPQLPTPRQQTYLPPGGGAPTAAAGPATALDAVSWTGFADPNEQAFSTEVPSGWEVTGGLLRHSAVDPSLYLRILSPDRRTYLMIGDPAVTLFNTRNWNYLPGLAFARAYVERAIPKICRNVTITGQHERPDLAQGPWAQFNPQARHDGGDVTFTCSHGSEQANGIIAVATYLLPGNALWGVDFLAGVITPPGGYDSAVGLIRHVIGSTRLNPVWTNRQQQMTAQVAHAIDMNTAQIIQLSEQFLANARERQHQMDQQFESFDRTIAGISPYADPAGNIYQLDNTQPYHWIGPGGRIITTTGPNPPPGVGWQPMREVPPQ